METSDVVHQFPVASALDPHMFWLTCFTKFTTDLKLAQKANISGYKPESRQQSPCLGNKHERKQPHHFLWHRRHLDTLDLSSGVRLSAPSFTVMSRAIRQVCWKDLNYYKKFHHHKGSSHYSRLDHHSESMMNIKPDTRSSLRPTLHI